MRGSSTSAVEVTNVSPHGFWLFIHDRELFLSFKDFPWFTNASIHEIANVELPSPHHLYWPDLDIDLTVESLEHPERYPLVSQLQATKRSRPGKPRDPATKGQTPVSKRRGNGSRRRRG